MHGSDAPRHALPGRLALKPWPACATLVLALAACSSPAGGSSPSGNGGGTASASASGGASGAGSSEATAASPGSTGGGTIQGSLVTSGAYAATWTVFAGNNGITYNGDWGITSDQGSGPGTGPEGLIQVDGDGTISFGVFNGGRDGTNPVALQQGDPFTGTGATVDVRDFPGYPGEHMICGFTIDTTLTGADGSSLKIKGAMKVVGTFPTTIGTPIPC